MTKRDPEFPENELSDAAALPHFDEFRDYEQFDDYHEDDPQVAAETAVGASPVAADGAGVADDGEGEAAGAAAATTARPKRTIPLRGLAMILITVAVLLVAWGIFATISNDDDADTPAETTASEAPISPVESGVIGTDGQVPPVEGADPAAPAPDADPAAENADTAAEDAGAADAAAGAQATDPYQVDVLNNSMVQGLAADVAATLEASGYPVAEVGNYASGVVPQTTVYFDSSKEGAEAQAREIADQLGGIAAPQDAGTPAGNTVVVVLAG
ncbi:MAG: LytR C-terminal domain-containing protein [Corynebacterium sp.]|nr:LytR C-terminal domain-containing protein [Corynebacterium sp.]